MDVMTGRLSEIGLSILLDELETTYSSGILKIFKEEKVATATIYKGCIVKCTYSNLTGIEALLAMIVLCFKMYSFVHNENVLKQPPIAENIEGLFIRGYQVVDEVNHLMKTSGQLIKKSNGYIPKNGFQLNVIDYISKPRRLDHVVERFIDNAVGVVEFINYLDKSNNLEWTNSDEPTENIRISTRV